MDRLITHIIVKFNVEIQFEGAPSKARRFVP